MKNQLLNFKYNGETLIRFLQQNAFLILWAMLFLTSLYILSTIIKNKRLQKRQRVSRKFNLPVQQEIKAFAGEDEYSTNLDLARAYIEIGRNELALKLLKEVINEGTNSQKQEAQKLLVDI